MYTYDDAGNIQAKKEYAYTTGTVSSATASHTYTYGNSNWGDLLTAYDGHAITTDDIGNPTSFYDGYAYTMEWEHGRQLKSVTYGNVTTRYQYNADGIRIKKTLSNGTWHEFHVMGGTIIGETRYKADGTVALWMRYNMDADGSIYGISTWYPGDTSWTDYYFVKNLQGDVIEVRQASTNTVVASYTYDAWGNVLSESGTLAHINRFRYRSYYFDEESALYYLQSRYYDPALGRFLNADAFASTGQGVLGNNMFAYCANNPVNLADPSGCLPANHFAQTCINDGGRLIVKYDVPLYDQKDYRLCWAFCKLMVEDYNNGTASSQAEAELRAIELAKAVNGDKNIFGEEIWNKGAFPPNSGSHCHLTGIYDLYILLKDGPVYAYYSTPGWGGKAHLVVVTGVDATAGIVYVNNPWGYSGSQTYSEFLYEPYGNPDPNLFMPFCAIIPIE